MGSLTPLASSPSDRSRGRSSVRHTSVWLAVATCLLVVGVLTVAGLLVYIALNSQGNLNGGTLYGRQALKTEQQLRAERLADSLGSKVKESSLLIIDIEGQGSAPRGGARAKRSPLTSSSSTHMEGTGNANQMFLRRYEENFDLPRGQCRKRSLAMCAGHVPFNSTTYPNFIGDDSETEANRSLPYFNYIAKSRCNRRIKQLLCTFLEPACDAGRPIPPCKKFCRIALEGCAEYIPATLELSAAFDCRRYPDSIDPRVCVNLAMGNRCQTDEFQCPDRSCVPNSWRCDGVRDCIFAADEANCQGVACSSEEFQCDNKCVPASWRCDGDRDCLDGSDEINCSYRPGCGPDRFKCTDGFGCIPKRWVCDGKAECRDGSDEMSCVQKDCTRGDFKCDNGICIPKIWLCDGQNDCKDNSDERSCSSSNSIQGSSSNQFVQYVTAPPPPPPTQATPAPYVMQTMSSRQYGQPAQQRQYIPNNGQNMGQNMGQQQQQQQQYQATGHSNQYHLQRPPLTTFGNFFGQHNNVYRYRFYKK